MSTYEREQNSLYNLESDVFRSYTKEHTLHNYLTMGSRFNTFLYVYLKISVEISIAL